MFFTDEVENISYYQYEKLLKEDDVREKIALILQQKHEYLKEYTINELSMYIRKADKDLFLKLKDGVYTLDQLKARIAERKTGLKYVVLDDLKNTLNPKFFEKPSKRQENLAAYEMFTPDYKKKEKPRHDRKSHFFSSVSRERGPDIRNY